MFRGRDAVNRSVDWLSKRARYSYSAGGGGLLKGFEEDQRAELCLQNKIGRQSEGLAVQQFARWALQAPSRVMMTGGVLSWPEVGPGDFARADGSYPT